MQKVTSAPGWQTKRSESWVRLKPSCPCYEISPEIACGVQATMPAGQKPSCKYLGNPGFATKVDGTPAVAWSLYDKADPGRGVSLTYQGGQSCSSGQRRALQVNFVCSTKEIEKIEDQAPSLLNPPS